MLAHLLDDGALAIEAGGPLRRERRLGERGARLGGQTTAQPPGVAHVQRHAGDEQLVLGQAQLLQQKPLHRARERPLAFQAHRRQAAALLQDALHVLAVVLALLFGAFRGIQIGVAGHADDVGVLDGVHREDLGGEHLDGALHQDELQPVAGQLDDTARLARQRNDAQRHALGAEVLRGLRLGLVAGALLLRLLRLGTRLLIEAHDDVQAAVFQMREGVPRVDDLRREEGQHVVLHVAAQVIALLGREVFLVQTANALFGEEAADRFIGFLVVGVQLVAAGVDGVQLLGRRHAGLRVDDGLLQKRQVGERTDAHHEELLQVAPEDGDEVQALEQRHRGIGPLVEHALVEIEPRELAILHIGRLHNRRRCRGILRCLCVHGPSLLPLV